MRKKIAIVIDEMLIGGIPKASVPLMEQLMKYADVTLILNNSKGELMQLIPKGVDVRIIGSSSFWCNIFKTLKQLKFYEACKSFIQYVVSSKLTHRWVQTNVISARLEGYVTDVEYDCAIGFHGMRIGVITRTLWGIRAKEKIAWIHGTHPFDGLHKQDVTALYKMFDHIYFASNICRDNFASDFPSIDSDKYIVSYCMLNDKEIIDKADCHVDFCTDKKLTNIMTVGRISPEKGQDMIPDIINYLKSAGCKCRWYLVGDGEDRPRIEKLAEEKGVIEELMFLGSKCNPYPYMKQCDIYVQPSYSEAYSLTAFEAATLGKPIVITDVAGATEILQNGVDSMVVSVEISKIAEAIITLIKDESLRQSIIQNLKGRDFTNFEQARYIVERLK